MLISFEARPRFDASRGDPSGNERARVTGSLYFLGHLRRRGRGGGALPPLSAVVRPGAGRTATLPPGGRPAAELGYGDAALIGVSRAPAYK